MAPSDHDCPLSRKLRTHMPLARADLAILADLHARRRTYPAGADMIFEGQAAHPLYILYEGWASSYKLLADGTRQILDFQIPGDSLGLNSMLFQTADHNIEPITDIVASEIIIGDVAGFYASSPTLATALLWAAARDQAMVVEHLINVGRRDAQRRTAHFLLELGARLILVGRGTRQGYDCPLSQYLLADALGLTAEHTNRVLRQLRQDGLVTFRDGRVVFDDLEGLIKLADFDMGYLDHGVLLR
ncbi:Crp/Fnr family transcriptional regulator [Pelagivirga sediminicola]|uniref:Crp/Fnr family transcriptional regulator n=1 Tax=Pelagivirga sediminicola TaxID=2170575 RepID=A0A2T7G8X7_9RHOB|nr:Crp/Fnr family transcriptional regulator [Pelagivirga sediminicola]PVA10856.1 Crp/Fnr family transcriptional regulator [Pelagivirga sediminicola]